MAGPLTYEPPVEKRRQMLEQRRDALREKGYAAIIDAACLSVDLRFLTNDQQRAVQKQKAEMEREAKVCYEAATEMQLLIEALDKPNAA